MSLLKSLLLPPGILLVVGFAGLWLLRKRARLGRSVLASALLALYVISTPLFAGWALGLLCAPYVDPRSGRGAQAIVVLGGGTSGYAPEYGAETVSRLSLMRVRYAAKLHAITGKPILVSGGSVSGETTAEAAQMRAILVEELKVPVRWVEDRSTDTLANALESRRILAPLGIDTIYLVTHAWHVPRARLAFEHAGFTVVAASTDFHGTEDVRIGDVLPRASALLDSYYFFHELAGYAWYWLKIRI